MERNLPYDLSGLRNLVRNILLLMLVCEAAYFLHSGWLFQFIGEVESGVLSSEAISEKADRIDALGAWVGWSYIAVNLICYIASGTWIYRGQ